MTAKCAQGDAVEWSSEDPSVATIDESTGVLTPVGEGSVVITATCSTDSTATATKTITVWKEPDVITDMTVAEVADLATAEDKTTLYEVTGYICSWANYKENGTAYGNYYLKDLDTTANASLYVYGSSADTSKLTYDYSTKTYYFNNPQTFLSNETTSVIDSTLGYRVTIRGYIRETYGNYALTGVITKLEEPVEFSTMTVEASSTAKTVYNLLDDYNFDISGFTVKVRDADGTNVRTLTTNDFTYSPSKFTEVVDKVTITGKGLYEGLSATIDVTVKDIDFDILPSGDDVEVELDNEPISYSLDNLKGFVEEELMYEWKSSTKGIVSFSSDDEASTTISFTAVGTTTVSIYVADLSGNELTKSFKVTVNAVKAKFELVENNLTDFTGEYIIAYTFSTTNKSYAFNGTTSSTNNYFAIDINGNIASAQDETKLVTVSFEKSGSGYLIKINGSTNNGKYFNYTASTNGFSVGTSGTVNSISVSDSKATISNGLIKYQGLNNSGQPTFRYYVNSNILPSLYKKVDQTATDDALAYAKMFNEEIGCNETGLTEPSGWNDMKTAWSDGTISTAAQIVLRNVDVNTETDTDIKKCIETYEYILNKYNSKDSTKYNDFMSRNVQLANASNAIYRNSGSNTTILVVILVTFASVTAVGGFFFLRKRKMN